MKPILYTNGDSVVWGAELENKQQERFSGLICQKNNWIDCNNASAGVSNDYIFRQTLRDVSYWLETGRCWSEESGWVESDEIKVVIGWTSPTRFEWWNGLEYQQERLWIGYDKWGENDKDRTTEDIFVLNQTEDLPSYIKTFNQIISLSAFLEKHNISHYFFNSFYEYKILNEPYNLIDKFGKKEYQTGLEYLWKQLPTRFKEKSMYEYIEQMGGGFLQRKHPNKESHRIYSQHIIDNL
jgi:hypothetical protein